MVIKTKVTNRHEVFHTVTIQKPGVATPEAKRFLGPPGAKSDRTCAVPKVRLLPHHGPADAEEVPQVAEDATVKGAVLAVTVLQVGDSVS